MEGATRYAAEPLQVRGWAEILCLRAQDDKGERAQDKGGQAQDDRLVWMTSRLHANLYSLATLLK